MKTHTLSEGTLPQVVTKARKRRRSPMQPISINAGVCTKAGRPAEAASHEDAVIAAALAILHARLRQPGTLFDSPSGVRQYLALHLAGREREAFGVMFLDAQHALIAFELLFEGTLTQTSVYPREVVKRALEVNASAVILTHNHPSGVAEPSRADEFLTSTLKASLNLVDVRTLDHIIVGGRDCVSLAERGLM